MRDLFISYVGGLLANLTTGALIYLIYKEYVTRRLRWFWNSPISIFPVLGSASTRPVRISYSTIDLGDKTKFMPVEENAHIRGAKIVVHAGDAEATAVVQLLLSKTLGRTTHLVHHSKPLEKHVDLICIGGPTYNTATISLIETLGRTWTLPYYFYHNGSNWSIIGDHSPLEIKRDGDKIVKDYGIFAKIPHTSFDDMNIEENAFSVLLAGLSMFGTLAAALFVTEDKYIRVIQSRLKEQSNTQNKFFCGVVTVEPNAEQTGIIENSIVLASSEVKVVTRR